MKTKDLIEILSSLPDDLEVKMYLFNDVPIINGGESTVMSCHVYDVHDVLVARIGNSVLLSSHC